jgi:hypothetical protein
MSKFDKNIFLI